MARGAESVHCPIQAPQSYVEPYMHLDPNRRTFAGMLAALDEAVPPTLGFLAAEEWCWAAITRERWGAGGEGGRGV